MIFKVMIRVNDSKEFYLDNKLSEELKIYVNDMIDSNEDLVLLIDGPEGAGKSLLSRQIAYYLKTLFDSRQHEAFFGVENVHFDINEYIKSSLEGKKYQINILDESRKVLNRRRAMAKDPVRFTNYLSECRAKNQVHLILLPSYCDVDKYIVMWRTKGLLHCQKSRDHETKKLIKGVGRIIPINNQLLFFWDRGFYEYPKFNPKKSGGYMFRWNNVEVLHDIKVYNDKKDKYMVLKYDETKKDEDKLKELQSKALEVLTPKAYSDLFAVSERTYYHHKKKETLLQVQTDGL